MTCAGVAAAFSLITLSLELWSQLNSQASTTPGTGALIGFIYGPDMETPVPITVVKIRNLQDGQEYASEPTDQTGFYKLQGIKEDRYILGVSTSEGDYNFGYELLIRANEIGRLSLALKKKKISTKLVQILP